MFKSDNNTLLKWQCMKKVSFAQKRLFFIGMKAVHLVNLILSICVLAKHTSVILDKFTTLDDVTVAIRRAGLEVSGLIFGKIYYKNLS